MPCDLHRDGVGDAGTDQVANRGAPQVVRDLARNAGCLAGRLPRLTEIPYRFPVAVEDVGAYRALGLQASVLAPLLFDNVGEFGEEIVWEGPPFGVLRRARLEDDSFEALGCAIEVAFHVESNVDDEGLRLWAHASHGARIRLLAYHD